MGRPAPPRMKRSLPWSAGYQDRRPPQRPEQARPHHRISRSPSCLCGATQLPTVGFEHGTCISNAGAREAAAMRITRMSMLWRGLLSGAGAAGTTTLNVITYLDIAARGRPTSNTPEKTVEAMAGLFGLTVPGIGD